MSPGEKSLSLFAGEKSWQRALLAAGEGGLEGGGNQVDGNRDGEDGDYGEDGDHAYVEDGDDAYGENGDDEYGKYGDKNKEKEWHLIIVATCAIVH